MKSSYSNSQGNCVDVVIGTYGDEDHVVVMDTKGKTGKGTYLLFDENEWRAFTDGVQNGELTWEALQAERETRMNSHRIAGKRVAPDPQRRTPENLAYINGRHAERNGWVPYTFERFCRRFAHDVNDAKSRALYDAFQNGRRAEAHEKSIAEGH